MPTATTTLTITPLGPGFAARVDGSGSPTPPTTPPSCATRWPPTRCWCSRPSTSPPTSWCGRAGCSVPLTAGPPRAATDRRRPPRGAGDRRHPVAHSTRATGTSGRTTPGTPTCRSCPTRRSGRCSRRRDPAGGRRHRLRRPPGRVRLAQRTAATARRRALRRPRRTRRVRGASSASCPRAGSGTAAGSPCWSPSSTRSCGSTPRPGGGACS